MLSHPVLVHLLVELLVEPDVLAGAALAARLVFAGHQRFVAPAELLPLDVLAGQA